VKFDIKNLFRHGDIIEDFRKNKLDGAFFGGLTGALAVSHLNIEPIVRLQISDSFASSKGLLIVRKNSNIKHLSETRNTRMAFVDRATTAGYLLPLVYLAEHGIDNYSDWFSSFYFSGTYEDAVLEVLNGHADIGATKNTVFYGMAANNPRITEELTVLALLPNVPEITLGLRSDLPRGIKTFIKEALLTMHETTEGRTILANLGARSFVTAQADDYQAVRDYAASINLDLSKHVLTGCGGTDCTCRAEGCTSAHNSCARSAQ
jgi:phosphonate transport system substrate-binding protein